MPKAKTSTIRWREFPADSPTEVVVPCLVVAGKAVYPAVWSKRGGAFVDAGGSAFTLPVVLWAHLPTYAEVMK